MRSIAVIFPAVSDASSVPTRRLVIDGTRVASDEFPYTVALLYCRTPWTCRLHCSGSLVTRSAILTAAHCVLQSRKVHGVDRERIPLSQLYAHIGADEYKLSDWENLIPIESFVTPDFGTNIRFEVDDDIALLFLSECPVEGVGATVKLATSRDDTASQCPSVEIAGFGESTNVPAQIRSSSFALRHADGTAHPFSVCERSNLEDRLDMLGYPQSYTSPSVTMIKEMLLEEKHMCFGGDSLASVCSGDSGSPILVRSATGERVQVGLVSYGIGREGLCGASVSYAIRVSGYADWIHQQLAAHPNQCQIGADVESVFASWPLPAPVVSAKATRTRCKKGLWQCLTGQCVDASRVCDGVGDCFDRSDERRSFCRSATVRNRRDAQSDIVQLTRLFDVDDLCSQHDETMAYLIDGPAVEGDTDPRLDEYKTACAEAKNCTASYQLCTELDRFEKFNLRRVQYSTSFVQRYNFTCPTPPPASPAEQWAMVALLLILLLIEGII